MTATCVALAAAALSAWVDPTSAHADELPLELVWDAPAECPSADDVRAELARIVEVEPGRAPSALRAHVTIARARDRLRLRIQTERDGETGHRILIADDCGQVLRAVTLVLALAYGEGVALRADGPPEPARSPAPPALASATEPPSEATAERSEAPATPLPAPSTLRVGPLLELGAVAGVLPEPTFECALGVELGEPWWRVRARGAVAPLVETDVGANVLARFTAMSGSIEGCGGAPVGIVRGEVCGGLVLGALYGRAVGSALDREAWAAWLGLRAAVGVGVVLDTVELRLTAALVWNTARPRFEITGLGEVHRVAEVSGHGAMGLAWFP